MDEHAIRIESTAARVELRSLSVTVLAAASIVVVLHEGAAFFAPVLVSVLLAFALEPFVGALTRLRIPRVIAVGLVYVVLAIALGGITQPARRQVSAFLGGLPHTIASVRSMAAPADGDRPTLLDRLQQAAKHLQTAVDESVPQPEAGMPRVLPVQRRFSVRDYMIDAGIGLAGMGARLFIIALFTFLLLVSGDLFKRKLIKIAELRWTGRNVTADVMRTIDKQIQRYLLARLLICGIVGTATAAALWSIGLRYALIWGAIAGALNVVPFIGPTLAGMLITLAAFLEFHSLELTGIAGGAAGIIAIIEGNLISPWLMSCVGELNTVAVFVSVLFWGWMWDVWGLLLAIPIVVAIKAAADHIEPMRPIGELLGR